MNMQEELDHYIYHENLETFLAFLNAMKLQERSKYTPLLLNGISKKTTDIYITNKAPKEELEYLVKMKIGVFYCCNATQQKRITNLELPSYKEMDSLVADYCPSWLSDLVNDEQGLKCGYDMLVKWDQLGYVQATKERLARSLLYYVLCAEDSLKIPAILEEHIWYLFEIPTEIKWRDQTRKVKGIWSGIFCELSNRGLISRKRLIEETLSTAHRNFKSLAAWFFNLLEQLQPTHEELLEVQELLLAALKCDNSKVQGVTLKLIKLIKEDPRFRAADLMNYLPFLLSRETKVLLMASLDMVDFLMKFRSDLLADLQCQVVASFGNKEEAIQAKAVKLILKYPLADPSRFQAALAPYQEHLLLSTKKALKEYLLPEDSGLDVLASTEQQDTGSKIICSERALVVPQSVSDLIFYAADTFMNPSLHSKEILLAALLSFYPQLREEDLEKLGPSYLQAWGLIHDWEISQEDTLAASFFVFLMEQQVRNYPKLDKQFLKIKETQEKKALKNLISAASYYEKELKLGNYPERMQQYIDSNKRHIQAYKEKIQDLLEWRLPNKKLSTPFQAIYKQAYQLMEAQSCLTLLSTPSHRPCFIDPQLYQERLLAYEKAGVAVDPEDQALALRRCFQAIPKNYFQQHAPYRIRVEKGYTTKIEIMGPSTLSPLEELSIPYQITSNPYEHDSALLHLCKCSLYSSTKEQLQLMTQTLELLYELNLPYTAIDHLFFAICLIHDFAVIRDFAKGILMEKTAHFDAQLLGDKLAELSIHRFAPIKRFSDMALKQLLGISVELNTLLEQTLIAFFLRLGQEVIPNQKKVLELYHELIQLNHSPTAENLRPLLEQWKTQAALKGIVNQLLDC